MKDDNFQDLDFEEIIFEEELPKRREVEQEGFHFQIWMIPLLLFMIALAILICIPLWKLTKGAFQENSSQEDKYALSYSVIIEEDEIVPTASPELTPTETPEPTATPEPTPVPTAEPTASPVPTATPEPVASPVSTVAPETTPVVTEPISGDATMSFTAVSEVVTAKNVTNLRSEPSTENADNIVAQLVNGESADRIGMNADTGWSKLEYNGQTVFAVSQYLTTDMSYKTPVAPSNPNRVNTQDGRIIIFTDCDDYITPKEYVNLRTEPSTTEGNSTVHCQVNSGETVHRTGYSPDSGWSRVEYDGKVLYVVSSYMVNVSTE